jgi:hypothetical protein
MGLGYYQGCCAVRTLHEMGVADNALSQLSPLDWKIIRQVISSFNGELKSLVHLIKFSILE